jgi:amino acid transporter
VFSVVQHTSPSQTLSWLIGSAVAVGALVSMLGFLSGSAFGTPRYLFAVAEAGELPPAFARLHARYASPHIAIVTTALVAAVLAVVFDYRSLLGMSNVAVSVQYSVTCLAVWRARLLKWRTGSGAAHVSEPHLATWTQALLLSVVPALGCLMSVWIVTEASQQELLWSVLALGAGAVVRLATARRQASSLSGT